MSVTIKPPPGWLCGPRPLPRGAGGLLSAPRIVAAGSELWVTGEAIRAPVCASGCAAPVFWEWLSSAVIVRQWLFKNNPSFALSHWLRAASTDDLQWFIYSSF